VQPPSHFVVIGAQRCGTTYLYRLLDEHPEIEMAKPVRPEPKFFLDDREYARGIAHYGAEYFTAHGPRVRGEKATSYLESAVALQRIETSIPGAPLVVVLRDPVRRAISNYRFSIEHGSEDLPMAEALRAAAEGDRPWDRHRFSVSPHDYLRRGRYVDHLALVAQAAPSSRVIVLLLEELIERPDVLTNLYGQLGVDRSFRPNGREVIVNASTEPPEPKDEVLESWLRHYFAEPNRQLAQYLGRPLPWPS